MQEKKYLSSRDYKVVICDQLEADIYSKHSYMPKTVRCAYFECYV